MKSIYFRALLFWGLTVGILVLCSAVFPKDERLSIGTAAVLTFALTALFAKWDGVPLSGLGVIPAAGSAGRFGVGILIGLGLVLIQEAAIGLSGVASLSFKGVAPEVVAGKVILYGLVAWREELAFRGYSLRRLTDQKGPGIAVLILTLLFALEHFWGGMNWWQALLGSGIGACLFAGAAIRSGGIALPLGIHLVWNLGQWCFGQKDGSGIWHWDVAAGGQQVVDAWAYAAYFGGFGLATALFWYRPARRNR